MRGRSNTRTWRELEWLRDFNRSRQTGGTGQFQPVGRHSAEIRSRGRRPSEVGSATFDLLANGAIEGERISRRVAINKQDDHVSGITGREPRSQPGLL